MESESSSISNLDVEKSQIISDTSSSGSQISSVRCDVCGKTFESEVSLRMHRMRAHKVSPRGERGEDEGSPEVPDVEAQLRHFLSVFGLTDKDARAAVEYLKHHGVDNLVEFERCLSDLGVSVSRRRLILESWSNLRGLTVPPHLLRKLGVEHRRYDYEGYEYDYERPYRGGLISEVAQLIKALKPEQPPSNSDNSALTAALERINELEKRLEESERKRIESEISSLKDEVARLRESSSKVENVYSMVNTAIREVSRLGEVYLYLFASYAGLKLKPPIRERVGGPSLLENLPPELLSEE